jgi:hypothetical protein
MSTPPRNASQSSNNYVFRFISFLIKWKFFLICPATSTGRTFNFKLQLADAIARGKRRLIKSFSTFSDNISRSKVRATRQIIFCDAEEVSRGNRIFGICTKVFHISGAA